VIVVFFLKKKLNVIFFYNKYGLLKTKIYLSLFFVLIGYYS